LMSMVGGAPAFALQAIFDPRWSLVLAMVVFSAAGVAATRIPRTKIVQDEAARELEQEELHQPSILLAGSVTAVMRSAVGFIVFFSAFAFHDDKVGLVFFAIAYGLGNLGGNLAAPFLRERIREEIILASAVGVAASLVLLGSVSPGTVGLALCGLGVAFGAGAGRLGFDSLLQRDGPDAARGRAFARFETRFQLAWVVGAVLGIIPMGKSIGMIALGLVLIFAGLSYYGALRAAQARVYRTTIRPKAVDRAIDRARAELQERRRRSRVTRQRTAGRSAASRRRSGRRLPRPGAAPDGEPDGGD